MATFASGSLVRLDGDPGYVECEKVGDVTVVVGGVRTIVAAGDVGERLVADAEREAKVAALKKDKQKAEAAYDAACAEIKRVVSGL